MNAMEMAAIAIMTIIKTTGSPDDRFDGGFVLEDVPPPGALPRA